MKRRKNAYNPKRRILPATRWTKTKGEKVANEATYGGNPEHKIMPGYSLTPPRNPRPGKTLCDADRVFLKSDAEALLRMGIKRGVVSEQTRNGWPQNVWAVSGAGEVFEAQLENEAKGVYHGYPMPEDDDFRLKVIKEWECRES